MTIAQVLRKIKREYDATVESARFDGKTYLNGAKAKEALICSKRIINCIHEFVKDEFIKNGVSSDKIYPPIHCSKPEIKVKGFLKSKDQDISIIPSQDLVEKASIGAPDVEGILTVNVRSQLSSLGKNIDTLYERTFAEPLNLHLEYPKQCLGEVYLIPTHEYDDQAMKDNRVAFKNVSKIEHYIRMFQAINNRRSIDKDGYKYERVCLLIVDFRTPNPKLYNSIAELISDDLIREDTDVTLEDLTINNFAEDLLQIYIDRFGRGKIA